MAEILQTSIAFLKGVGDQRAALLKKEQGLSTWGDLLRHYPFRYIDKTSYVAINDAKQATDPVQFKATVKKITLNKGKYKKRLNVVLQDESGMAHAVWFQGWKWVNEQLTEGRTYLFFGKPTKFKSLTSFSHPQFELYSESSLQQKTLDPVYPSTEALSKANLESGFKRKLIRQIFDKITVSDIKDQLGGELSNELKLVSAAHCVKQIHFPNDYNEVVAAKRRIKFEELFFFQMSMLHKKHQRQQKLKGLLFGQVGSKFMKYFKEKIPFELTNAQKRVVKEIRHDLGSGIQMNRLLQGDVGSGKTMVGLLTMLLAIDNGYQACLMAPTEILAQQHYTSIKEAMKGMGVNVGFLSGSIKGKKRKEVLKLLKDGVVHILIGTHALIEDWVVFERLGLAIIDEQHRFGVAQRAALWAKTDAEAPHILVMTATPIPRTLSLTTYGDLDISIIDELPPGRKPITTRHIYDSRRVELNNFIEKEITAGRQIYVVYPLIEESSQLDLRNLEDGYERLLQRFPRPKYQYSIVHGKMKAADKDSEMQRFVKGETQIMVATTVIEVGVNVPNASVMVIENAERFGLSQLHQLRGRVGRGSDKAYCILVSGYKLSANGKKRLNTMVETQDGFKISEVDLELRGPGNIEGTQQSGVISLRMADIIQDKELMMYARQIAEQILLEDPNLTNPKHQNIKQYLLSSTLYRNNWGRIS